MFNNILVPYDGSQPSHVAVQHAFNIAKMDALSLSTRRVHLLYVIQEIHVPPQLHSYPLHELDKSIAKYIKELYQILETKAMDMLKAKSLEYVKGSGEIAISTLVLLGDPADKIIEFAEREKIDLIIMGNVGLRAVNELRALGSVSRRVSEMASCPVLLVH
ncbi:MAG TPA: universal stress protein [Nitrososphaeraceae archaeon]|nr:universal stress protein [Nitrososphaeraceae archaeon]